MHRISPSIWTSPLGHVCGDLCDRMWIPRLQSAVGITSVKSCRIWVAVSTSHSSVSSHPWIRVNRTEYCTTRMKKDSWTLFPFHSHFAFLAFASKLSAFWLQHVLQSSIHCWWNERRFSRWLDVVWGEGGGPSWLPQQNVWVSEAKFSSGSDWRHHLSLQLSMGTFLEEWRNPGMKTAFNIAPTTTYAHYPSSPKTH
jgi:hypothetical protein